MTRLSIFHPAGRLQRIANPFGKDVANMDLFRALAQHGGLEQLDVLALRPLTQAEAVQDFLGGRSGPTLTTGPALAVDAPRRSGALLRGQPYLDDLAWMRRAARADRDYSLIGLIHTLAPPAIRQHVALCATAPVHPWDALICTSPAVQQALGRMLDAWGAQLAARTGGSPPPRPALPLIPLGVDAQAFAAAASPQAGDRLRGELGLAERDVLVIWVGRLSYFEKAFPQAMFRAVQQAAKATGAKVQFAMAGWFPQDRDRELFEAAARAHAPDVAVRFLDGNDRDRLNELWAGADIFLSLVDNIQETFGITPLEAMAAGLPVVVSDWDGYRFTVRDGVEGFLVPTLGGPTNGVGASLMARHVFQADSYQAYVGAVAQHTAVHVGRAADALSALIREPDLRRRLGAAGRERVRTAFDWPVVARQIVALVDDLASLRRAAPEPPEGPAVHPLKGDPFTDFAGFATHVLNLDTALSATPGVTEAEIRRVQETGLDVAFPVARCSLEECVQAFGLLALGEARTVRDILLAFPVPRRRQVEMGLAWMAKQGFVDWLA